MWPHDIIARFDARPTQRPSTWRAHCVLHEDRSPSLSLWLAGGRLLLGCWSCRRYKGDHGYKPALLARVGLTMKNLFPPEEGNQYDPDGKRLPPRKPIDWVPIEHYDYEDEDYAILYRVTRLEPAGQTCGNDDPTYQKTFRQLHPGKDGEWIPGIAGIRRIIYRLPEILAAPYEFPVLIVEGERKANALHKLGLLATTGCGGCGMGWLPGYSKSLEGRRCVLLPDNNECGVRHMFHAATSLMTHGAASVRIVPIPGLAEDEDVGDWLGAGGTRVQLIAIIQQFPEWRPS